MVFMWVSTCPWFSYECPHAHGFHVNVHTPTVFIRSFSSSIHVQTFFIYICISGSVTTLRHAKFLIDATEQALSSKYLFGCLVSKVVKFHTSAKKIEWVLIAHLPASLGVNTQTSAKVTQWKIGVFNTTICIQHHYLYSTFLSVSPLSVFNTTTIYI